ncbi:MAG: hypothetical protein ACRD1R_20125 [Acidobacteriota bacterium]
MTLLVSLGHYLKLMAQVIDQSERSVLRGETVPAAEKVCSIFVFGSESKVAER